MNLDERIKIYIPHPELCVITSYFNATGYTSKFNNYNIFVETLKRSGISFFSGECAFQGREFQLPEVNFKFRANSILWQKERILNRIIQNLPKEYKYIAWIDADVLFTNEFWAIDTVKALQINNIVQLFKNCVRLPQGHNYFQCEGEVYKSCGYITSNNPAILDAERFDLHGHTGFAWAARREILEDCGLYESAIAGAADHLIFHAIYNDLDTLCLNKLFKDCNEQKDHFYKWADYFYKQVQGKFSYVDGNLYHLWHGSVADRRYAIRNQQLSDLNYNPADDLIYNQEMLEFSQTGRNKGLERFFINYFESRKED